MKKITLLLATAAVCAWSIDIPKIGFARDAQGRVSAINGLAGNFILGDSQGGEATLAFSWNGSFGIRKTDATLEWWDDTGAVATIDAPPGDAIIGFGPQAAFVFSKSAAELFQVQSGPWRSQRVPLRLSNPVEEMLALTAGRESVTAALRRDGAVVLATFDLSTGARTAEQPLARVASSLLLLDDLSILGAEGTTLWLTRPDGSEWSGDAGVAITGLALMGRGWIQVQAADRQLALRLSAEPQLYLLPQPEVNE